MLRSIFLGLEPEPRMRKIVDSAPVLLEHIKLLPFPDPECELLGLAHPGGEV